MAQRKARFGQNLGRVLDDTPAAVFRGLLERAKGPEGAVFVLPDLPSSATDKDMKQQIAEFLATQGHDILTEIDKICREVLELSEGKGVSSLNTVAGQSLYNVEWESFQDQPDEICRSIWVYLNYPGVFRDAESFHFARMYRDFRRMYSAFEVDLGDMVRPSAENVDLDPLCRRLEDALQLRARTRASAIDLPPTEGHPKSLMVALRHPGPLSSIRDHRDDGGREIYYYRPANEAILIYTPELKKLEICAESFEVRDQASKVFAEVVLGQNLSEKPLTRREFNLERFRESFDLPLPVFDDVEIQFATVTEAEMRLGSWSRRLNLRVTKDDDIEAVAQTYLSSSNKWIRMYGFSKIVIAIGFQRRTDGKTGTFNLSVSGGNRSNIQSQRDPFLRDLGTRLLSGWGILDDLRVLTEREKADWFRVLLSLYELPEKEVSGAFFRAAGVDPQRLVEGGLIERKSRQTIVLIDEDDAVVEGEWSNGHTPETLVETGSFGVEQGAHLATDALIYRVDRRWLAETILKAVSATLAGDMVEIVDDNVAQVGETTLADIKAPVYLVRGTSDPKTLDALDIEFRRRHSSGPGIVLCAGDSAPKYLGPNVAISLPKLIAQDGTGLALDREALERAFQAGRRLVPAGQVAQVIRYGAHSATLHLPGSPPLNLTGADGIKVFERLVNAAHDGSGEVKANQLTEGMGSNSPQQVFSKKVWQSILGAYIVKSQRNGYWRLNIEPAGA